ncbi:hypothetical protein GUITHDRAFT_122931 [Guillardia theta CCMP2712]|uniref:Uncharacterized protein n=1 Tax=Guillardia theta (strain CCMP2712) TaxID=905079 RepID=L1I484_GUITC|nr:hypothetical protein GUITHDRAFT_122931 [Guillardia theta CCMP2712]EKX30862.1 hypothetical protein GUITHDRAFT_122931 [Guillardia theta CCMP2712]|eukprot:XP_005817842.1 hypothetical protein GUITHDRAFT_122931 [Guillardia theta CCMP2712]
MQRARACCLQWGAALLLLSLFAGRTLAAVVTSGGVKYTVAEMAQLQLEGGVTDLKATDMKIYWGSLGSWKSGSDILSANTVIEIFLPRFSGSSNLFGAYRSDTTESTVQWLNNPSASVSISEVINKPWAASASVSSQQAATGPGIAGCYGIVQDLSSNAFDLKQIKANAFSMCYWDSQRETLRLYMPTALQITGVYINKVSMYQNYDVNGKQNGLGPLPPIGGIDEKWYQLANVAFYQAEGNSLGCAVSDLTSFPSTPCTSEYLVYQVPFDQYRSVRFGTDHPPMPVQKGAGGVGTVAAPAFVYAAAAGNNDGPSQDVCITVTLISSATIYSVSVNPTQFHSPGLSGSATRVATLTSTSPNARTNKVLNQAYFDSAGTMSFELVPGNYIQAGEVVTFTFKLKTGSNTQASQSLKAVLSGQICQNNDLCTSSTSVSAQMSNDVSPSSKIIEVVGNKLRTSIFQSSSDPGSLTHVFVTMTPNFNVDSGSVISLQGLCGTQTNSPKITVMSNRLNGGIPLTDMCSSAGNPTEIDIGDPTLQAVSPKMDWSLGGALKITVSTIMTARNTYVLSWDWQNSNSGNAACPVTVTVSKGSTVVNAESVENMGNTVGYVAAPGFIKYKIGQTTTRPDVTNYICITLRSNYRVSTQSNSAGQNNLAQITLSGLQGSQTVTQPIITACPSFNWDTMTLEAPSNPPTSHFIDVINGGTLHRTTSWSAGTTVLTVNQDDTANNMFYSIPQQQDIKFAIVLKNAVSANPCQTVSLSLSALGPGDNQFTQNVQMVQNSVDRALQDGETDGDVCVLKSYAYGFPTRLISQSTSSP